MVDDSNSNTNNKNFLKDVAFNPNHQWKEKEIGNQYTEISKTYENDIQSIGYPGPKKACEVIKNLIKADKNSRIIDFGCGTGLIGKCLKEEGFTNIVGCDASKGMLEEAKTKDAYKDLKEFYLCNNQLPKELLNNYDIVCSNGLLGMSHALPSVIDEKISVLDKKGLGYIVICMTKRWVVENGFDKKFEELKEVLTEVHKEEYTVFNNKDNEGFEEIKKSEGICFVFKVNFDKLK